MHAPSDSCARPETATLYWFQLGLAVTGEGRVLGLSRSQNNTTHFFKSNPNSSRLYVSDLSGEESRDAPMRPTSRKGLFMVFALLISLFILQQEIAPSLSTLARLSRTIPGYIRAFMIQVQHKGDDDVDVLTSMPSWSTCLEAQACLPKARYLSPRELMSRPLSSQKSSNASIPKLIHQSWSDNALPLKFQEWSDTWRTYHPDWEWVLWTDADNRALVKNHFPWFKDSYEKLNAEIFKADAVRPLYMYAFGGYVFRPFLPPNSYSCVVFTLISMLSVSVRLTSFFPEKSPRHSQASHPPLPLYLLSINMPTLVKWAPTEIVGAQFQTHGWLPPLPIPSSSCLSNQSCNKLANSSTTGMSKDSPAPTLYSIRSEDTSPIKVTISNSFPTYAPST